MKDFAPINICFFGVNRSLSATISSINRYIFECLESCSVDYSVYGSFVKVDSYTNARSSEFDAVPEINERELISFDGFKYVDQYAIDDLIEWDKVFRYGDTYGEIENDSSFRVKNSVTKNIFRSLFALKSSYGLIPDHCLSRPTIFLRPDLEILSDLDWEFYLSLLSRKPKKYAFGETDGVAVLPAWHAWDGLNDRFAICSPGNAASSYATRFDDLIPYLDFSKHPIHPESFLLHTLRARRVEVLPIVSTPMVRIRAQGVPQSENFSQGARSYNPQAEAVVSLGDMVKSRDSLIDDLNKRFQVAKDSLSSKKSQCEALQLSVDELRAGSENLKSEITALLSERDISGQELFALKEEVGSLVVAKNDLDKEKDGLLKEKDRLIEETDRLIEEKNGLIEEKNGLAEERDGLIEEKNGLAEERDGLIEEMGKIKRELLVASQKLLNMKRDLEARDNQADLTLRHFHQVQHELEHYFLLSRKQAEMLQASEALQNRALELMANCM